MRARHGISQAVIDFLVERDVVCVYCRTEMIPEGSPARQGWASRAKWATIEHLNHLPHGQFTYPLTAEYLAIACTGCNAARRDKPLAVWVDEMGIRDTVAPVVTAYLRWPTASLAIDPACRLEDRLAAESQRATRKASRLGATLALAA